MQTYFLRTDWEFERVTIIRIHPDTIHPFITVGESLIAGSLSQITVHFFNWPFKKSNSMFVGLSSGEPNSALMER